MATIDDSPMLRPCRGSLPVAVPPAATMRAADRRLRFERIDVLRHALAVGAAPPPVVEHDDADVPPVAAVVVGGVGVGTFVEQRILEHGEEARAVGADGQALVAAIVLASRARRPAVAAGHVVQRADRSGQQHLRRLEDPDQAAAAGELVDRRPVLVGDDQVAGAGIDDEALGIEAAAERRGIAVQEQRIEPVQRDGIADRGGGRVEHAPRILERDRLLDLHVQDAAGDGMHVDVEALHAHGVVDQAAAGTTIGERPPFVAHADRSRDPRTARSGRRWRRGRGWRRASRRR